MGEWDGGLVIPPFSTFSSKKMIEIVVETNTWFQKTALTVKTWKRLLYKRTCSHRGREYCILPQTPLVFCSTCLSVMNGQSKKLKVPNSPWSLSVALCASSGSPSWWKLHPPAEDFLAFSMDVILVTLELIHLEFLGWNAVPKNGPVSCEMGLNYDQTNAKLTFRMQFRGYILYSCFRWVYHQPHEVYIGAPMINESHLRWLVTSQTGVVPVSWGVNLHST